MISVASIKDKLLNLKQEEKSDFITETSIKWMEDFNKKRTTYVQLMNLFYCFKAFARDIENKSNFYDFISEHIKTINNRIDLTGGRIEISDIDRSLVFTSNIKTLIKQS